MRSGLLLLAVLSFFGGRASAQNLYISNMSVWYRNAAQTGNGFCSDVTSAITVPVTGAVSQVFSRSVAGTVYVDFDNDGFND